MKQLMISGRSGSGKSVVLQTLEDLQYYCVDNLPPALLPSLVEQMQNQSVDLAVSLDARNICGSDDQLPQMISRIREHLSCEIIFLDASDETLIRRFKETRRRHPLTTHEVSLHEALHKEHLLLAPLLEMVDLKIDTDKLTPQALRKLILDYINRTDTDSLSILIESFGFKYGMPQEADFIFDVRCLPNPYWDSTLRQKNGLDPVVTQFLDQQAPCHAMFNDIATFLEKWIPAYQIEHRKYLTIGVGCTGGMHRSVYIADRLYQTLSHKKYNVKIRHRDIT